MSAAKAGFTIHHISANRSVSVKAAVRDAGGLTFVIDRKGRIYSPDVKSRAICSSDVNIGGKALAVLVRIKAVTPEEARAHINARMEAAFSQAEQGYEEIERVLLKRPAGRPASHRRMH